MNYSKYSHHLGRAEFGTLRKRESTVVSRDASNERKEKYGSGKLYGVTIHYLTITDRTLDVVFSRCRGLSFTRTLRKHVQRRMRVTHLCFCLWVIVNEKPLNLEQTAFSVLSVIVSSSMGGVQSYLLSYGMLCAHF